MQGYSRDIFEEMDEIFDHLFLQMQEDFMTGTIQGSGFRVMTGRPEMARLSQEIPSVQPRASAGHATEVHMLGDEVMVIAELPGADPDTIRLGVHNSVLTIEAEGPGNPYHATADLPSVDENSLQSTFRNGVLEVTFRVRK